MRRLTVVSFSRKILVTPYFNVKTNDFCQKALTSSPVQFRLKELFPVGAESGKVSHQYHHDLQHASKTVILY